MHSTEELIELFLSKYNYCPIPRVGTLELKTSSATPLFAERLIQPPVQSVRLVSDEKNPSDLIDFISAYSNQTSTKISERLMSFSDELKALSGVVEKEMPSIGSFFVSDDGYLEFKSSDSLFKPDGAILAERVVHPDVVHEMRVGDIETNSAEMRARLNDIDKKKKQWWWIPFVIVLALSIGILAYYYSTHHSFNPGENAAPVPVKSTSPTYSTGP